MSSLVLIGAGVRFVPTRMSFLVLTGAGVRRLLSAGATLSFAGDGVRLLSAGATLSFAGDGVLFRLFERPALKFFRFPGLQIVVGRTGTAAGASPHLPRICSARALSFLRVPEVCLH
jgi:hypothetical protein